MERPIARSADDRVVILRNANLCHEGLLLRGQHLSFSGSTGLILSSSTDGAPHHEPGKDAGDLVYSDREMTEVNLDDDDIVVPGLIELQTNGLCGIHFTTLTKDNYEASLEKVSIEMAKNGVTGWYATIPTVEASKWKQILPYFKPRSVITATGTGSPLLGAHVEGPYLHPLKKGAHNDSYFKTPSTQPYRDIYGDKNLRDVVRYITIAPELEGALEMIRDIRSSYPHITISIGHSTASYDIGRQAIRAGARSLTHIFNAMNPLHHRDPGLVGTLGMPALDQGQGQEQNSSGTSGVPTRALSSPYFTMIPDLVHLHPTILRMCYQSNPTRCVLITDSIELAGLPDGIYPPNGQITYPQRKMGNRATNVADVSKGEVETLIGSCITLPEGVRNMKAATGVDFAEVVRCASTNIADLVGDESRGRLVKEKRADFVVFDGMGQVKQTWIAGRLVFKL